MSVTVLEGDCIEVMPTLPRRGFAVVVADPPYAIPAQTTQRTQWNEAKPNVADFSIAEGFFRQFFNEVERVLQPNGVAFVFCDETCAVPLFRAAHRHFQPKLLVWDKQRLGMGHNYRRCFELAYFLKRWDEPGLCEPTKGRSDIIRGPFVPPEERIHPSEKPVWLVTQLIEDAPEGALLDPFAGSGSAGVAAKRAGRDAVLIEMNEEYAEAARRRVEEDSAQTTLRALATGREGTGGGEAA